MAGVVDVELGTEEVEMGLRELELLPSTVVSEVLCEWMVSKFEISRMLWCGGTARF